MKLNSFNYKWVWEFKSTPEKLWSLAADTNRFNFDTGLPKLIVIANKSSETNGNGRKLMFYRLGIPVQWTEYPFEWIFPERFGVVREYDKGPLKKMTVKVYLQPSDSGGTQVTYFVEAEASNLLGLIAIPVQIGIISRLRFEKTLRLYDVSISASFPVYQLKKNGNISAEGERKLNALTEELHNLTGQSEICKKLSDTLILGDNLSLYKMRPYLFANLWGTNPKKTLETFLYATRLGILDLRWDILCPLCRGASESHYKLENLHTPVHCESCNIDYEVNFDKLVEIVFTPNPQIRKVEAAAFCVGGPQVTPHIIVQKNLTPGDEFKFKTRLEPGRYRMRSPSVKGSFLLEVLTESKVHDLVLILSSSGWDANTDIISGKVVITVTNKTDTEKLFIFERTAWIDDAVTASEVTAMQSFRDLFTNEALRPGQQISVGSVALMFTDLKNSTSLYRRVGDANAFGYVMKHFDILKAAIDQNDGALVKTIGDATMAVFTDPLNALKAIVKAQADILETEGNINQLRLKSGIHFGPCIAVNLNNILDYFGSTVNIAARLEGLSSGSDIIISDKMFRLPNVQDWLRQKEEFLVVSKFESSLKGFEGENFDLWKIHRMAPDK